MGAYSECAWEHTVTQAGSVSSSAIGSVLQSVLGSVLESILSTGLGVYRQAGWLCAIE